MKVFHSIRIAYLFLALSFSLPCFSQAPIANFQSSVNSGCVPVNVNFNNTSQFATKYKWDFGNGMTSTISTPSIVYYTPGQYTITLIAINNQGQSDTVRFQNLVQVNALPVVNFLYVVNNHCVDNNFISFTNLSDSSYSFIWDFGDGNSSTMIHPSHQYIDSGNYSVKLVVTDSIGCNNIKQATQAIQIVPQPQIAFYSDVIQSCDTNQIFLFNDSSQTNTQWLWSFGDGNTSQLQRPVHTYGVTGKFNIQLIGTDTNGCSDTLIKSNYITVDSLPRAQFSSDTQSGCTPFTVQFIGDSANINNIHTWDFGNGVTQNGFRTNTTYSNKGLYSVKLIVEDQNSCIDSSFFTNYIDAFGGISASFTTDTSDICINTLVLFTNASVNGVTFEWDSGDSTHSADLNPTHSYSEAKGYIVKLVATDSSGCESVYSKAISVIQLQAKLNTKDTLGCAPHVANFENNSTHASKWFWSFGDGNTSQLQNPSHTYQSMGSYSVALIVESSSGCSDTISYFNLIKVGNDTISNSLSDTILGCLPLFVDFSSNKLGNNHWNWTFGNGGSSNVSNPSYTFIEPGTHSISLFTQNSIGCPLIISNYATVIIDSIKTQIRVAQYNCNQRIAQLTDSTENAISWFWDFGDGTYSTLQSPIHRFTDTIAYDISLTITTTEGCTHSVFYPAYLDFLNCFINGVPVVPSSGGGGGGGTGSIDSSLTIDSIQTFANKCAPQFVQFSNRMNNATNWSWNFGDGT
ncbi:MAG: PKD domain-containing protein, partial [Flavobacteriales bacterium]|nr:PKD domain-containing protein [Flavobacteriales bacterium]